MTSTLDQIGNVVLCLILLVPFVYCFGPVLWKGLVKGEVQDGEVQSCEAEAENSIRGYVRVDTETYRTTEQVYEYQEGLQPQTCEGCSSEFCGGGGGISETVLMAAEMEVLDRMLYEQTQRQVFEEDTEAEDSHYAGRNRR